MNGQVGGEDFDVPQELNEIDLSIEIAKHLSEVSEAHYSPW